MAETLLALLLVTTSAKGSSVVYRWPPAPEQRPRRTRPPPPETTLEATQLDNPYRASHFADATAEAIPHLSQSASDSDVEYSWRKPDLLREMSFAPHQHGYYDMPASTSPNRPTRLTHLDGSKSDYDEVFGYSGDFLAGILCPNASMCHQKFELLVNELAFIGHPVCADMDGNWLFKSERSSKAAGTAPGSRGRETRSPPRTTSSASPSMSSRATSSENDGVKSQWLTTFHFVLVLDIPDPSSSASGNVSRYFDIIYEQIAFTVTAVLFQEQVLYNFVETQCDTLGTLKDACSSKNEPYSTFAEKALTESSIASAMKLLYDAIKNSRMAYITLHNLPLEIQLPPYLDALLHTNQLDSDPSTEADSEAVYGYNRGAAEDPEDDAGFNKGWGGWGNDMSIGWKLPPLTPWKSLLLLDDSHKGLDPSKDFGDANQRNQISPEDRTLWEGLVRFLDTASVTLSLAEMAGILDWDLESQVMPTVRWLVQHRRAKVVDMVHPGLKTVFTLPPRFEQPLADLTREFEEYFSHPQVPSLPEILSVISNSHVTPLKPTGLSQYDDVDPFDLSAKAKAMAQNTHTHFFAAVVKSRDLIPMYHDVVLWMLKHDMLVTLHLRIRILATSKLKIFVRYKRGMYLAEKAGMLPGEKERLKRSLRYEMRVERGNGHFRNGGYGDEDEDDELDHFLHSGGTPWFDLSPKAARRFSRRPSNESAQRVWDGPTTESGSEEGEDGEEGAQSSEAEDSAGWDTAEDTLHPTIICDPGRPSPMEGRWLAAMSENKEPEIARRFQMISQYFDGKKTDDEILYKAGITRKELREILHHYEEYLQTFLHPS